MSVSDRKPYKVTNLAGWYVAGHKIPSVMDEDGVRQPRVGYVLHLTDEEAKHELAGGTIEPAPQAGASA